MKQAKVKRFRFGQALSAATMQRTGVAQPPSPVPITQLRVMLSERAFLAGEAPTPLLPDRPGPAKCAPWWAAGTPVPPSRTAT